MIKTKRNGEWLEIIIPDKWANKTVQDLFQQIWKAPKKQTHILRMEKGVKINEEPANWLAPLKAKDKLEIHLFTNFISTATPTAIPISILYEDDHLLIVNKPAYMDTHPNTPEQTNTLTNAVAHYVLSKGENAEIKHIHRLDRDTTGAILFSKHPFIGSILDQMLERREIVRTYLAIVHGIVKQKKGIINESIGRDRHHATKRRVSPTGQQAITHYERIETDLKDYLSIVKCQLKTGRTHQIRVHMSHIGHPLAGDSLYGGKPIFKRQALHAVKLELWHPFTGEFITCHAPFLDEPPIFTGINPREL